MRKKGLEPPRREAPDPKSGAATNYATSAVRMYLFRIAKIDIVSKSQNSSCIFAGGKTPFFPNEYAVKSLLIYIYAKKGSL